MCISIDTELVSERLAARSRGKMHNARGLTRANRILRLYVSETNPQKNIIDLVNS